jgi:hypothetical protein
MKQQLKLMRAIRGDGGPISSLVTVTGAVTAVLHWTLGVIAWLRCTLVHCLRSIVFGPIVVLMVLALYSGAWQLQCDARACWQACIA